MPPSLYLALEDDYRRLQERLYRMFGTDSTDNLFFAVSADSLGNGLDAQLQRFIQEHADTCLIIIDTLQKVREVGGDNYSYANDYEIITRLKQFADRYGIVEPLIKRLKALVKTVLVRCFQAIDDYHRLNVTNANLYRENERLSKVNEKLADENENLRAENKDYKLLRKVFGNKQIDSLLEQARQSKQRDICFRNTKFER